jgi:hypothetical protein
MFLPTLNIRPGYSDDGRYSNLFLQRIKGRLFPVRDRWTLRGEVIMDALLDVHATFASAGRAPYITLSHAFGPLDLRHTHITFTLSSDCWDDSCALVLQGRQGLVASIPAQQLLSGKEFDFGRLKVLVKELSRQEMAAGYDARQKARLFRWLRWLGNLYRVLIPAGFLVALFFYIRSVREASRRRILGLLPAVSTALLAAVFSRLLLFSFIDAVSWPAVNLLYFGPCYPLVILFCGTAVCGGLGED